LPFFPTGPFFVAEFSGCPFFRLPFFPLPLFLTLIFCCPFSYPVIFRCRILPLPNFPVAQSSVALFTVAFYRVCVYIYHIIC